MKPRAKRLIFIGLLAFTIVILGYFMARVVVREVAQRYIENAIDDRETGLKEGVSRVRATDSPFDLPISATDIHYAYELYWQGGCSVCRYTFPKGDLRKQGATHLKTSSTWRRVVAPSSATVPEHRFSSLTWFQPSTIGTGWESNTSGILWEPKVWIDEVQRHIYVINQN